MSPLSLSIFLYKKDALCTLFCHLMSKRILFNWLTINSIYVIFSAMNVCHIKSYLLFTYCLNPFYQDTCVWICVQWQLSVCSCFQVTRSCMSVDLYRSASVSLILLDFSLLVLFQLGSLTKPLVSEWSVAYSLKKFHLILCILWAGFGQWRAVLLHHLSVGYSGNT